MILKVREKKTGFYRRVRAFVITESIDAAGFSVFSEVEGILYLFFVAHNMPSFACFYGQIIGYFDEKSNRSMEENHKTKRYVFVIFCQLMIKS